MARLPKPLLYSTYINDRAIVQTLDMLEDAPAGAAAESWPTKPAAWTPGDDWPTGDHWSHEEVLFIRTHQAFEVWFALIVHELASIVDEASALGRKRGFRFAPVDLERRDAAFRDRPAPLCAARGRYPRTWRLVESAGRRDPGAAGVLARLCEPAVQGSPTRRRYPEFGNSDAFHQSLRRWERRLRRAADALRGTIGFFDVLATMASGDFLAFRGRLQPASGFGSAQFREIEYLLGLSELHATKLVPDGRGAPVAGPPPPRGMAKPRHDTPSLAHGVEAFSRAIAQSEVVAATLLEAMPEPLIFSSFLEACLRTDDALLQWRDRHLRFVEAMIGTRRGTGGGGIAYLRGTVADRQAAYRTHALPCLWQARSFVRRPG